MTPDNQSDEPTVPTMADFGVTLDLNKWEDPKESFDGIIEVSTIRAATEDYIERFRETRKITGPLPEPLPQWDLRVRRFDLILQLPDGSQVPAIRYGTIDLKKWVTEQDGSGHFVNLNSRYPKEHFVLDQWGTVFPNSLEPPEQLVGRKATFDFYATKSFGRVVAKRVLVPTVALLPDYEFSGEVRVIQVQGRDEEGGAASATEGPSTDGATGPVAQLSEEEARIAVARVLVGKNKGTSQAELINMVPPEARINPIVVGLATGKLIDELIAAGQLAAQEDGTLVATA